jgi:predicted transcriptional regulator
MERGIQERLSMGLPDPLQQKLSAQLEAAKAARDLLLAMPMASAPTGDPPRREPPPASAAMAADSGDMIGRTLGKRYDLLELIGQGGMGRVYQAFDRLKQAHVAVKVIAPEIIRDRGVQERLVLEAKNACALSHPNIIRVHDVAVDGDCYYITMELLHGRTLRAAMDEQKRARVPFSVNQAQAIARDLLGALAFAHQHLVHRDLKPENIWVCDDGAVKIMDFGLAHPTSGATASRQLQSIGSAYYLAPEVMRGAAADHRADQYSLGVVLYELVSGRLPTGASKPLSELRRDAPVAFSSAVMKSMSQSPEERFASAAAFLEALDRVAVAAPSSRKLRVAGIAAGVGLLLAGLGYAFHAGFIPLPGGSAARESALRGQQAAQQAIARLESAVQEREARRKDLMAKLDQLRDASKPAADSAAQATALQAELKSLESELLRLRTEVYPDAIRAEVTAKRTLADADLKDGQNEAATGRFDDIERVLGPRVKSLDLLPTLPERIERAMGLRAQWREGGGESLPEAERKMPGLESALAAGDYASAVEALEAVSQAYGPRLASRQDGARRVAQESARLRAADAQSAAQARQQAADDAVAREAERVRPGRQFRDRLQGGGEGPLMVVRDTSAAAPSLKDGANLGAGRARGPVAISASTVSAAEFATFVRASGYLPQREQILRSFRDGGTLRDDAVAPADATAYATWLSSQSGAVYSVVPGRAGGDPLLPFSVQRRL